MRAERTSFKVLGRGDLHPGEVVPGPAIVLEPTTTTYVDVGFRSRSTMRPRACSSPTAKSHVSIASGMPASREARVAAALGTDLAPGSIVSHRGGLGEASGTPDPDPVTTEIVRHGLNAAAEQMKRALVRTAFSPVIYEVLDFAAAIYDRQLRLLAAGARACRCSWER